MLLVTDRHTKADLQMWASLEEGDIQHEISAYKVANAIESIVQFAKRRCYLATSWGKDSLVAAHLAWRAKVEIPFVFIRQFGPGEDPYQFEVQDRFEQITGVKTEVVRVPLSTFSSGRSPALEEGIKIAQSKYGVRYIGGIRAEESTERSIRLKMGLSDNSCWPIGSWTVQDVFAYIAQHDLPCHPAYAMLGGGRWDRRHIRVSTIGGHKGTGIGRQEWEHEYYGDVVSKMKISCRLTS